MTTTEYPTVYMPDTGKPAPPVLTKVEFAVLLRMNPDTVDQTIHYYRKKFPNVIRGVQVGKRVHFDLRDAVKLIDAIKEQNPR